MNKLRLLFRSPWLLAAAVALAATAAGCAEGPSPVVPEKAAASATAGPFAPDSGMVATPAGWYRRACVHEVPNGARVDGKGRVRRRDGSTYQLPWCAGPAPATAPVDSGWIEWASYSPGNDFGRIDASWTVPANPTGSYSGTQTYYSFPGIQSSAYINQPVIQYGYNGHFGGSYWTAASWHCNSGSNCTYSTPINLAAGDAISGTVVSSGCIGGTCTWTITTADGRTGQSSAYTIQDTQSYWYALGGAVEVYGLTSCSQFPRNGITYTGVALYNAAMQQVTPSWSNNVTSGLSPSCGFATTSTASTVSLAHNPAPPVVTSMTTSPTPPPQYVPFTITINGSGFDPATVQLQVLGTSGSSCPPPNGCTSTSYTTKTSTQLVIYPFSLSIKGTYSVYVRNANTTWAGGQTFTIS